MVHVPAPRAARWLPVLLAVLALGPPHLSAQTIRGRLLDGQSGRPIGLGILVLLTLEGDTVGLTATTADGRFSVSSPDPGTFLLHASAFGYTPRQEGQFELGEGGAMDVEFRIAPLALALEDMLVSVDRPRPNHPLIQNGFVRRYQQGLGHFITPRDLERTVYRNTEALFYFIPGVRVFTSSRFVSGGRALLGVDTERVVVRNPYGAGWCAPALYVDGILTKYSPEMGETLSLVAPLAWIDAVEIFRSPAEVPPEYSAWANCGVILIWLKR